MKINHKKQSGAVLFVSLIMLILLTLLGVSGMQSTILEEKMSGNYRDQNVAFQAAEATLLQAENYIMSPAPTYPGVGGLLDIAHPEPADYTAPALWSGVNSAGTNLNFGANFGIADPRYVIKKVSQVGTVSTFRVTARAQGASPGTQVILQSVYERTN